MKLIDKTRKFEIIDENFNKITITIHESNEKINLPSLLRCIQMEIILTLFKHTDVKQRVANALSINRTTLIEKMKAFGIFKPKQYETDDYNDSRN